MSEEVSQTFDGPIADVQRVIEAAYITGNQEALPKSTLVEGDGIQPYYLVHLPASKDHPAKVVQLEAAGHPPAFKTGNRRFVDAQSLAVYHATHRDDGTTFYGSFDSKTVQCIFDDHSAIKPGRMAHDAFLLCRATPEWDALKRISGKQVDQDAFATFIDDYAWVFAEPDPARLSEIVLNLEGTSGVDWQSRIDRTSGGVQIGYVENNAAATKSGMTFPVKGKVDLPVFIGGDPVELLVKFRYRVNGGALTVGLVIDQLAKIERDAFLAVCKQVESLTGATVLLGP